jgi:hypothetical protein
MSGTSSLQLLGGVDLPRRSAFIHSARCFAATMAAVTALLAK